MRERLPRWEDGHLPCRVEGPQCLRGVLGLTAGRRDDEQRAAGRCSDTWVRRARRGDAQLACRRELGEPREGGIGERGIEQAGEAHAWLASA